MQMFKLFLFHKIHINLTCFFVGMLAFGLKCNCNMTEFSLKQDSAINVHKRLSNGFQKPRSQLLPYVYVSFLCVVRSFV